MNESPTKLGAENYMVMLKLTSFARSVCGYLWTVSNNNNDAKSIYVRDHMCQTKLPIFSGKNGSVRTPPTTTLFLQNLIFHILSKIISEYPKGMNKW